MSIQFTKTNTTRFLLSDICSSGAIFQRDVECYLHGIGDLDENVSVQLLNADGSVADSDYMVKYVTPDRSSTSTPLKYKKMPDSDEPVDGNINIYADDNEKWEIALKPHAAGGSFKIKIINGKTEIILDDILFGDVWVAGGQSNMEYSLAQDLNAAEALNHPANPNVRFFNVHRINVYEKFDNDKRTRSYWSKCEPGKTNLVTAVGYYFAKHISEAQPDIPIGIINCNWGGTSITAWMNEDYLKKEPRSQHYIDDYYKFFEQHPPETFDQLIKDYEQALLTWNNRYKEAAEQGWPQEKIDEYTGPYPWMYPLAPIREFAPTRLFGTMFMTFVPYACKGAIYYQGETDVAFYDEYESLMHNMLANWREVLRNDTLPLYFVQLATYRGDSGLIDDWAYLRDSQLSASRSMTNSGLAVILDHGDEADIHPKNKKPVGDRLALLARKFVYGENIVYSGPLFTDFEIGDDYIDILFECVGDGLELRNNTDENNTFEIAGDNGKFVLANVKIHGDKIRLTSDCVTRPVNARYGWRNFFIPTLFNANGLPASSFATDVTKKLIKQKDAFH